jgi:hypothetical protein
MMMALSTVSGDEQTGIIVASLGAAIAVATLDVVK